MTFLSQDGAETMDVQALNVLETMSDAFVLLDTAWSVRYMNRRAETILEKTREELLGRNLWDAFPRGVRTVIYDRLHEAVQTQRPAQFVTYYPPLDVWAEIRAYPSPAGLSIYFLDVSERKHMEEAVRVSEERLRVALQNSPITVYTQDTALRYTWIYNTLMSFSPDEVIGSDDTRFILPEEAERLMSIKRRVLETGVGTREEIKTSSRAGTHYFDLIVEPLRDESGNIVGVTGASVDITERKHIEARLQRLVDSNIIGVFFCDVHGKITEANDVFLHITGYTQDDLSAGFINWMQMTPKRYAEADAKALQDLNETGAISRPYEKEYIRKDGSLVPVLVTGAYVDERRLEGVVFVLDIRERKEIEKRKDEFISLASHELKTPITVLRGLTQLLARTLEKQGVAEPTGMLARMDTQIDKITRLVTDFLDVSKIQAGRMEYEDEPIDIDALVAETIHTTQLTITTHTITLHGASQKYVQGDESRIAQVFTNLISNAAKYSPAATTVDVYIEALPGQVAISVRDYGIGIPQEHVDKIFDRFYRADSSNNKHVPGLGIGLYISKEIVQRHGGAISVESVEGQGATFRVTLPTMPAGSTSS